MKRMRWLSCVVRLAMILSCMDTAAVQSEGDLDIATLTEESPYPVAVDPAAPKPNTVMFSPTSMSLEVGESKNVSLVTKYSIPEGSHIDLQLSISDATPNKTDPVILRYPNVTLSVTNATGTAIFSIEGVIPIQQLAITVNCSDQNCSLKTDRSFLTVDVLHSNVIKLVAVIVGWMYFVAWTVSFYPQYYTSIKRRSVVGLDFNFVTYNFLGFLCYSIFNCTLFWNKTVQEEYFKEDPYGAIPVQTNDVFFALHALAAVLGYIIMILIFDRGHQRVAYVSIAITSGLTLFGVISLILAAVSVINWLKFIQFLSYIKLVVTILKYIPQVYLNFKRKSTVGWSIGNVLLDFTGGFLSLVQMFMIAYNFDDWRELFGDFTKFGLGLISVIFDIIFMLQHYCIYRKVEQDEDTETKSVTLGDSYGTIENEKPISFPAKY